MHRIALSMIMLAGETLAHPGHHAPVLHAHGWEYALLAAAIAIAAAAACWMARRK